VFDGRFASRIEGLPPSFLGRMRRVAIQCEHRLQGSSSLGGAVAAHPLGSAADVEFTGSESNFSFYMGRILGGCQQIETQRLEHRRGSLCQVKSSPVKSNQIKSNQTKRFTCLCSPFLLRRLALIMAAIIVHTSDMACLGSEARCNYTKSCEDIWWRQPLEEGVHVHLNRRDYTV
jgi:hypothetical protein